MMLVSSAFFVSGCLIELDEVREPLITGDGGATGGATESSGGTSGSPSDGGSPPLSGGSGGGTGGDPEPAYGPNLITNGDFSEGTTGWDNGGLTPSPPPIENGMGCTSDGGHMMPPDQFIGWSGGTSGATLEAGTYRYDFRMRTIGSPNVEVKVASTQPPNYQPWLLQVQLSFPADSDMTYTHQFVVASPESQMGLLFNAKNGVGKVCVDDVSLRRVLGP